MKQIHKTVPLPKDLYTRRYFTDSTVFFDIETTGFSRKYAFVYLIGMAVRKEDSLHVYQFLAQNRREEAAVLSAFYDMLPLGCDLVTFNGSGFDIPFLKQREACCGVSGGRWDSYRYTDLYKLTAKLSRLFQLPDKKQKSVERFLGIEREDRCSGGELIDVFFQYEKQPDLPSETLLLLHNYEDVLGMAKLLSLLSYRDLFVQPVRLADARILEEKRTKKLYLTLTAPVSFPVPCVLQDGPYCLLCKDSAAGLKIDISCGEMRYYYENFKEYYYLPEEDMAIHKSVAAYVDPAHRRRATASNCYTKRDGCFLPQEEGLFSPCLYPGKKAGRSYFAVTEAFLRDTDALERYASYALRGFFPQAGQL